MPLFQDVIISTVTGTCMVSAAHKWIKGTQNVDTVKLFSILEGVSCEHFVTSNEKGESLGQTFCIFLALPSRGTKKRDVD